MRVRRRAAGVGSTYASPSYLMTIISPGTLYYFYFIMTVAFVCKAFDLSNVPINAIERTETILFLKADVVIFILCMEFSNFHFLFKYK